MRRQSPHLHPGLIQQIAGLEQASDAFHQFAEGFPSRVTTAGDLDTAADNTNTSVNGYGVTNLISWSDFGVTRSKSSETREKKSESENCRLHNKNV
jgi:hypothetical protein